MNINCRNEMVSLKPNNTQVSGSYPFENPAHPDNVSFTLANVRDGKFRPLPPDVSPQCCDLIGAMLKKRVHKRISLSNIAKHVWMKMQMEELSLTGKTLPGSLSLKEMIRKDQNSNNYGGNSNGGMLGLMSMGRKNSTVSMTENNSSNNSNSDTHNNNKSNNANCSTTPQNKGKDKNSLNLRNTSKVSPRYQSPSPNTTNNNTLSEKEKEKDTSFRFGRMNFFGSRRST